MSRRRKYERSTVEMPFDVTKIGHPLKLSGFIFQGGGEEIHLYLPDAVQYDKLYTKAVLTPEQWSEVLRHSNDPVLELPEKAFVRKAEYAISGHVQQEIWARDNFRCMVCGRGMGDVQLTIDHWTPLEAGGKNNESNYISMCRACNKHKGKMLPNEFCAEAGINQHEIESWIKRKNDGRPTVTPRHLLP